jgi:hypothetical protein
VALLVLLIAGDQVGGRALSCLVDGSGFRYSALYRGGVDAEIVIVGNSRAVASLPPPLIAEATGKRTFSIAYNGLNPELSTALLADYLDRNRAPSLIIVEASLIASEPEPIGDFKLYIGHSDRLTAVLERHTPTITAAAAISQLFRVNSEFLYRALYYRGGSDQSWMNRGRMSAARLEALAGAETDPLPFYSENLAHLDSLIALCRQHDIELRLLIAPFLPLTRDALGVDSWIAELHRWVAVDIEDYSNALDDPALFADRVHSNELGAAALIDLLF